MAEKKDVKKEKEKAKKAGQTLLADVPGYKPRLAVEYRERIVPAMMQQFGYRNVMQVPRLVKIVLNMGIGEASRDAKLLEALKMNLATIAGQQPVITKAKKSIANFKIREGMPVGCMVSLRHARMYDFLDRLVSICIPRIRDFRGLSPRSFDGRGNYALGVDEQSIFPEIHYDDIPKVQGMDIVFVTTAKSDEEALSLLKLFGMPFRN